VPSLFSSVRVLLATALTGVVALAQSQPSQNEPCYPWRTTVSALPFSEPPIQGFSAEEVCRALVARESPQLVNGGTVRVTKTYTGLDDRSDGAGTGYWCMFDRVAVRVADGTPVPSESGPWAIDGVAKGRCVTDSNACEAGNPTEPGLGVKSETHTDYAGAGAHALSLVRSYRSQIHRAANFDGAARWQHNYDMALEIKLQPYGDVMGIIARRAKGSALMYSQVAPATWRAQVPTKDVLSEQRDAGNAPLGFTYKVFEDDSTERYDATGRLLSITARNGWITSLAYSDATTPTAIAPRPGLLISVKNHFGRELRFTYDAQDRVVELLPPGAVAGAGAGGAASPIRYAYDEAASLAAGVLVQGQLTSVTWQDGTVRRYHYENTQWPQALTGITDEAGVRFSTYSYDGAGRVARSERAGGADRMDFSYDWDDRGFKTTVTSYGSGSPVASQYVFGNEWTHLRLTDVSAPCPLCGNTAQTTTYNASGDKIKQIAHDGSVTFSQYDARGRETERATFPSSYQSAATRPALVNASKVVSTKWHATFNLPTQVAEPNKTTANTYSAKGMLTGQSWTATTDATGAAKFSAVKTGSAYATGYGYNANNIVTSAVRKTDATVVAQTTYTVSAQGNATKATNVLSGQSTTSATHDVHGRLVSETDPFGTTTTTYSARGFVLKSADESVTTDVVHNAIGLVTEVVTGTGFTLRWTYKPDHTVEAVTINGSPLQVASLSTKQKKTLLDFFVSTAVAQSGTIVLPPPSGGIGLRGGGIPGICRAVMHEIGRRLVESVSTEDTCSDEKKQCDPCDQVAENLGWTSHGGKHKPKKNMPWPDVVRGTATGDAKYTHNVAANEVAQRAFEMAAWNRGTPSNIRKRWRFMKFDFVVGAKSGVETVYMRIECTDPGVIHGHPVTPQEYREHVGKL
jgi:YD repeat-containing protein